MATPATVCPAASAQAKSQERPQPCPSGPFGASFAAGSHWAFQSSTSANGRRAHIADRSPGARWQAAAAEPALGNRRAWARERRRPRPTPLATPRRVPPRRRGPQVLRRGAEPIGGAELSAVQEPGPGALPSGSAQIPAAVAAAPMGGGCGQAGSCRTDSLSLSSRSEGSGSSRWAHRACQAGPAVASSAGCRAASQPVWSTDEGRWLLHGRLLAPSEDSAAVPCDVGCDELVPCVTPEASRRNTGLRVFRGNGSNCLGHGP